MFVVVTHEPKESSGKAGDLCVCVCGGEYQKHKISFALAYLKGQGAKGKIFQEFITLQGNLLQVVCCQTIEFAVF